MGLRTTATKTSERNSLIAITSASPKTGKRSCQNFELEMQRFPTQTEVICRGHAIRAWQQVKDLHVSLINRAGNIMTIYFNICGLRHVSTNTGQLKCEDSCVLLNDCTIISLGFWSSRKSRLESHLQWLRSRCSFHHRWSDSHNWPCSQNWRCSDI